MSKNTKELASIPTWVTLIIKAGRAAPSADNSQPWHFFWGAGKLELRLGKAKNIMALGIDHPAIGLSMGCAVENMIQAALYSGVPDDAIQLFPEDNVYLRIENFNAENDFAQNEELALFARHTNRHPFKPEQISAELEKKITNLQLDGVEIKAFQDKGDIAKIASLINKASQARFQNEQIHQWFVDSLRFTKQQAEQGDGLDLATLALPPGGSWLLKLIAAWSRMKMLNRLGMYKLLAQIEAASFKKCGSIIAIYGDWDSVEASVESGRMMQRTWVTLNENGYAVQPFFVLSDQLYRLQKGLLPAELISQVKGLSAEATSFFNRDDKQLLMLLRVGKPVLEAEKSLRMPLSEILSTYNKE